MSLSKHYVSLSLCVHVSVYHMPLSKHYVSLNALCLSLSTMSLSLVRDAQHSMPYASLSIVRYALRLSLYSQVCPTPLSL